ncbi:MAG: DUF6036 family nucleotidyltransferase [Burkholderiales bacterium]
MKRIELARLLKAAKRLSKHREFVVIGSLSVLGSAADPPPAMIGSIDVDFYPKADPGRIDEIVRGLGEGSAFHQRYGVYADPVSPHLASLPDGWERRLVALRLGSEVIAWCLEPNDAAVSKYVRCEERDRVWCRAGLAHRILSARTIRLRLRVTFIVEPGEIERARAALEVDVRQLRGS